MELVGSKLIKSRTQKRQKRLMKNRRRNQRKKLEVKLSKQRKIVGNNNSLNLMKENDNYCTMSANAFWENYKVAHDWQYRHNVAWWRSRSIALEQENHALREKIRELDITYQNNKQRYTIFSHDNYQNNYNIEEEKTANEYENYSDEEENLEFHVDEKMMQFLEQSLRHKMELKRMRDFENHKFRNNQDNELKIRNTETCMNNKIEDAKLLYGRASSRILTMETSLQGWVDQLKDCGKSHYWPNIPLNP